MGYGSHIWGRSILVLPLRRSRSKGLFASRASTCCIPRSHVPLSLLFVFLYPYFLNQCLDEIKAIYLYFFLCAYYRNQCVDRIKAIMFFFLSKDSIRICKSLERYRCNHSVIFRTLVVSGVPSTHVFCLGYISCCFLNDLSSNLPYRGR